MYTEYYYGTASYNYNYYYYYVTDVRDALVQHYKHKDVSSDCVYLYNIYDTYKHRIYIYIHGYYNINEVYMVHILLKFRKQLFNLYHVFGRCQI